VIKYKVHHNPKPQQRAPRRIAHQPALIAIMPQTLIKGVVTYKIGRLKSLRLESLVIGAFGSMLLVLALLKVEDPQMTISHYKCVLKTVSI
jgi:hypothetical protein